MWMKHVTQPTDAAVPNEKVEFIKERMQSLTEAQIAYMLDPPFTAWLLDSSKEGNQTGMA